MGWNLFHRFFNSLKGSEMNNFVKALGAGVSFAAVSAHAEVPAAALTAITAAGGDLTTAIAAVIAVMVAVWGLKKLGTKMGWF